MSGQEKELNEVFNQLKSLAKRTANLLSRAEAIEIESFTGKYRDIFNSVCHSILLLGEYQATHDNDTMEEIRTNFRVVQNKLDQAQNQASTLSKEND